MFKKLFVFFLILSLFVSCAKKEAHNEGGITVTNTSVVTITADCVSFDVNVRVRGENKDDVKNKGNIKANKVRSVVKSFGIDEPYNKYFSPLTQYFSYTLLDDSKNLYDPNNEEKKFEYYEYLNTLNVKIELSKLSERVVGKVIDDILKIGDIEIRNVVYDISDNRKANAAVRKISAESVMKKINSYAEGSGVKVKGVRSMHEGYYTRDTGIKAEMKTTRNAPAFATNDVVYLSKSAEADENTSTRLTSKEVNFSAEVEYTASLDTKKNNTINVSGYSEVKVDPDIANFNIAIRLEGDSAEDIAKKGADIVRQICSKLDDKCDIITNSYSINAQFIPFKNASSLYHNDRGNEFKCYEFLHNLTIRVEDCNKDNRLGDILDKINSISSQYGTITTQNPYYNISDNTEWTYRARKGAAENGKEKCDIYAQGAGVSCKGLFGIRENYSSQDTEINADELYYGKKGKVMYSENEIAAGETVIFRDKVSVRSQLTVTADI